MAVFDVTIPIRRGTPFSIGLGELRLRRSINDDLFIDCESLDQIQQPDETVILPPVDTAQAQPDPNALPTPINDALGLPWSWGNGDVDAARGNPKAYTTVSNYDINQGVEKCNVKEADWILRAACITSYLANRAVINEDPVNHTWFSDNQGYQTAFFDQVLRAYVGSAAQGKNLKPAIKFYTQDPEGVIKYLANAFSGRLTENYIRVVMYWLARTWGSIVHPMVMEPTEDNLNGTSAAAKMFVKNNEAYNKTAKDENCTYLGIDFCEVGSILKWAAIIGGVGLVAYVVFSLSSIVPRR